MRTFGLIQCSLILLFGFFHHQAAGLQCYVCNSHDNSMCAETKLPENMKKDCASVPGMGNEYTMCRKITQVIEFAVNGLPPERRIIRGCGWKESDYNGRCYLRSGFGGKQTVCSCLEDNCNSAPKISISTAFLFSILVPALSYILNKTL